VPLTQKDDDKREKLHAGRCREKGTGEGLVGGNSPTCPNQNLVCFEKIQLDPCGKNEAGYYVRFGTRSNLISTRLGLVITRQVATSG
jgi:hypothetical protein